MVNRNLVGILMSLLLIASYAWLAPAAANAGSTSCDDTTPSRSSFDMVDNNDNWSDTVFLTFRLSRNELRALECAPTVTIDFRMIGYETHQNDTDYEFSSDTLSVENNHLWYDSENVVVMSVVIDVDELVARQHYDLSLYFGGFYPVKKYEIPHLMSVEWAASEMYEQTYEEECWDDGAEELDGERGIICRYRYDEAVVLGEFSFPY